MSSLEAPQSHPTAPSPSPSQTPVTAVVDDAAVKARTEPPSATAEGAGGCTDTAAAINAVKIDDSSAPVAVDVSAAVSSSVSTAAVASATAATVSASSSPAPTASNTAAAPPAKPKPSTVQHTIATQGAAAISTITLYPLDVVKLRFMSQDGTEARKHNNTYYTSTLRSMRDIYRGEGIGALYKGCHVAVGGSIFAWGLYMYLYRALTALLVHNEDKGKGASGSEKDDYTNLVARSLVSILSSALSSVITCPIFLIKTRMQVEDKSRAFAAAQLRKTAAAAAVAGTAAAAAASTTAVPPPPALHYTSFRASFLRIVQTNGPAGLWRGLSAQLLLGVPNSLHFPIYDTIKAWRLRSTGETFLTSSEVFVCSTITKLLLMTMTHPLFVLKTRMQDHRAHVGEVKYVGLAKSFAITCKREGVRGFYRGTIPSIMQAVPRSVMHTFVYEKLLQAQVKAGGWLNGGPLPAAK